MPDQEKSLISIMRDFELKNNEKIEGLKIEQAKISEIIVRIEDKLDDMNSSLKLGIANAVEEACRVKKDLEEKDKEDAKKYAPHIAWDILKYGGAVIGGAIIIALLSLILNKPI